MDTRLIFLDMWGFKLGSEKDSDGGQWLSPMRAATRVSSGGFARCKAMCPCFLEKTLRTNPHPVPKPTQVGGYKDTKARERNLVKELGNIAP